MLKKTNGFAFIEYAIILAMAILLASLLFGDRLRAIERSFFNILGFSEQSRWIVTGALYVWYIRRVYLRERNKLEPGAKVVGVPVMVFAGASAIAVVMALLYVL